MGKSKKKSKLKDEFFDQLTKTDDAPWSTAPASEMMVDDGPATATAGADEPQAAKATHTEGMQVDKPLHKGIKLGVAKANMKRGQKSHMQRKRKVGKLEKAMARADKSSVRVNDMQSNKIRKLSLKHMY